MANTTFVFVVFLLSRKADQEPINPKLYRYKKKIFFDFLLSRFIDFFPIIFVEHLVYLAFTDRLATLPSWVAWQAGVGARTSGKNRFLTFTQDPLKGEPEAGSYRPCSRMPHGLVTVHGGKKRRKTLFSTKVKIYRC
jgi:hypothetical protein